MKTESEIRLEINNLNEASARIDEKLKKPKSSTQVKCLITTQAIFERKISTLHWVLGENEKP